MDEIPQKTFFMKENTRITHYLPYPVFLLDISISQTAKTLYALLLNRAMLSQKNGWIDEDGKVFIIFPIEAMSEELNKSMTTVKKALIELYNCGLLERKRLDFGKPNYLYVKLIHTDGNVTGISTENDTYDSQFSDLMKNRFQTANNYTEITDKEIPNRVMEQRKRYGRYQNILLSDEEYELLSKDYPHDLSRFIEELSAYLAATKRSYENYEATLRLWASRDRKNTIQEIHNQDYSCEEGESY